MIDPRFAGEISMGVSAPTPSVRDTWGMKGDVTAPWDNYGRVSEIDAGNLPEVTINATRKASPKVTTTNYTSRVIPKTAKVTAPEIIPNLDTIDESFDIDATPEDIRTRTITSATSTTCNYCSTRGTCKIRRIKQFNQWSCFFSSIMSNLFTSSPSSTC